MKRLLHVWWEGRQVGVLSQNEHGDLSFAYTDVWASDPKTSPLSASLPKREKPFGRRECRPFFAGLLPDEGQRESAAKALGVSKANDFALLDELGGDVAGALMLLPEGIPHPDSHRTAPPTHLDEIRLVAMLDELPKRPLLAGQYGLRLSLAGAQSKVPVVLHAGAVALPAPGQPTTHILKPPIPDFTDTTENEAFTMRLAAAVGLKTAPVSPRIVGNREFLLIERYDRRRDAQGNLHRVHQEDFCQALGHPPERKYASEGGPTFQACFELLRRVAVPPAPSVLRLLDAAIFNVIVGNADAHGKNFSILYTANGPALAPLYDLLATTYYSELSPKFAMKIGKRTTLAELDHKGWALFTTEAGLGFPYVRDRVAELSELVMAAAPQVAAALAPEVLNPNALDRLVEFVIARARAAGPSPTR